MVFVIHLLSAEQQPPVFQIAAPFLEVSQGGRATIGEWGAWGTVWGSAHCQEAQLHLLGGHLRATLGENSLIQPEHHQGTNSFHGTRSSQARAAPELFTFLVLTELWGGFFGSIHTSYALLPWHRDPVGCK